MKGNLLFLALVSRVVDGKKYISCFIMQCQVIFQVLGLEQDFLVKKLHRHSKYHHLCELINAKPEYGLESSKWRENFSARICMNP